MGFGFSVFFADNYKFLIQKGIGKLVIRTFVISPCLFSFQSCYADQFSDFQKLKGFQRRNNS